MTDWRDNLLQSDEAITRLLEHTRRVAVLGIKPESHADRAAHYVPRYLADAGLDVVPVPVYYPEVTEILGRPVHRSLAEVPGHIDLVNLFRRPQDVPPHVDDILLARPDAVWMQSGIRNDTAAERLAGAGIKVVQDRCLMVEHRRRFG